MKRPLLLITLLFAASQSFAQTKEMNFEYSSFDDIKAKAKKENKLIFMDAYTSWCGPCKWMAANVFTNDTVADYFNAKFINAKFDMEAGEGIELAKRYNVNAYPTLLFIDGNGNLVHRVTGAKKTQEFIKEGQTSYLPEKRFSYYTEKYNSKKYDPTFLIEYTAALKSASQPYDEVLKEYFSTQKDEELSNRINWNTMYKFSNDYKSREFIYLLNNMNTYQKLYTDDSVNTKIGGVISRYGLKIIQQKPFDEKAYTNYVEEVKQLNYSDKDAALFNLELNYTSSTKNWPQYIKTAIEDGDKHIKGPESLEYIARNVYKNSDDKIALEKVESWMKKTTEENPNKVMFLKTYAGILYKLHKKEEAQKMAENAIELSKNQGIEEKYYTDMLTLLENIKKL